MIYCDNLLSSKNHSLTSLSIDDFVCHYHDVTARNDCDSSCSCYISQFNFTTLVDCSSRNLTFFPKVWPRQARVISLKDNLIEKVEKGIFTDNNSVKLEILYLQNNKINVIEKGSFQKLSRLTTLQLHRNHLKNIDLTMFVDMTQLKNLTLHGNPWHCDCTFGPSFKEFVTTGHDIVKKPGAIYCKDLDLKDTENNKIIKSQLNTSDHKSTIAIPLLKINFLFCGNVTKSTTITKQSIIGVASVVTISLGVGCIVILIFKKRLLLRVCIYNKFGARFHHEDDDNEAKPYDVFIAHAEEDERLVVEKFLTKLEGREPSYKVRRF